MKKLKNNRAVALFVICLIYVVAIAVGILTYIFISDNVEWWVAVMIADVTATIVVFVFSLLFKNASIYDPYWSVQPLVITVAFLLGMQSLTFYHVALAVAVLLWGARLTANWAYTFTGLSYEDWRYVMLKEKTKKLYPIVSLIGIHLVPTMIVYFCIMPVALVLRMEAQMSPYSLIFVATALLSAMMQGVADCQMHKYRKNRVTLFIRTGLWKYSRHPNYLGEILMWWSIALACVISTGMALLLNGAILNTIMFLTISIPLADKRQSRKEGFVEYKKQTRALLPIKKKQH